MSETLTDPVLGTLHPVDHTHWDAMVWFTPKHQIKIVFDQWIRVANDVAEQLARASEAYLLIRRRQWEHRSRAAELLLASHSHEWTNAGLAVPDGVGLARALTLIRAELFGDGSVLVIYRAPPPFAEHEISCDIHPDGRFGSALVRGQLS